MPMTLREKAELRVRLILEIEGQILGILGREMPPMTLKLLEAHITIDRERSGKPYHFDTFEVRDALADLVEDGFVRLRDHDGYELGPRYVTK